MKTSSEKSTTAQREGRKARREPVAITGAGCVFRNEVGIEALWNSVENASAADRHAPMAHASLAEFPAVRHLSDPRMMKAVSAVDGFALAAVEDLRKSGGFTSGLPCSAHDLGIYVGAAPAYAVDNINYADAVLAACNDPTNLPDTVAFGRKSMDARPNTLLVGLPNNVLCYSSMIFGAQGPNSNYTSFDMSGHLAVTAAMRRLQTGQIDLAVAGAYGGPTEKAHAVSVAWIAEGEEKFKTSQETLQTPATSPSARLTDGAFFMTLERASSATERNANVIATILGHAHFSDGPGNLSPSCDTTTVELVITESLDDAGVSAEQIGLVLWSSTGDAAIDKTFLSTLSRVFAKRRELPALGDSAGAVGYLVEPAGLPELLLAGRIWARGAVPAAMQVVSPDAASTGAFPQKIPQNTTNILVIRTSLLGESSAFVLTPGTLGDLH